MTSSEDFVYRTSLRCGEGPFSLSPNILCSWKSDGTTIYRGLLPKSSQVFKESRIWQRLHYEGVLIPFSKDPSPYTFLNENFNFQDAIQMEVNTSVMMHNLSMDVWGEKVIGMITSSFDKPMIMNSTTYHKRKFDYVGVLVVIPMTTSLPTSICVMCHIGK